MNENVVNVVNQFNYYNSSKSDVFSTKYIAVFNDLDKIEVFDYNNPLFFASVNIDNGSSRPVIEVSYGNTTISSSFDAKEDGFAIPDCVYITDKINNLLKCIR